MFFNKFIHYKGKPFTDCVTKLDYTESRCIYKLLLARLCEKCACYPGYMNKVETIIEELDLHKKTSEKCRIGVEDR